MVVNNLTNSHSLFQPFRPFQPMDPSFGFISRSSDPFRCYRGYRGYLHPIYSWIVAAPCVSQSSNALPLTPISIVWLGMLCSSTISCSVSLCLSCRVILGFMWLYFGINDLAQVDSWRWGRNGIIIIRLFKDPIVQLRKSLFCRSMQTERKPTLSQSQVAIIGEPCMSSTKLGRPNFLFSECDAINQRRGLDWWTIPTKCVDSKLPSLPCHSDQPP